MNKNTAIKDVMTEQPHSVGLDQGIKVARDMLNKYGIRHLPVQQGGRLVGIVSERDINLCLGIKENLDMSDIYTPEPYMVESTARLAEVASKMAADRIGCALIVEKGKLVGIYTATDACRDIAMMLSE